MMTTTTMTTMTFFAFTVALVALESACSADAAPTTQAAADERDVLKFSDHADAIAEVRQRTIEQELARLGDAHAWAGRYYWGDGLGANVSLWLAPEAGFLFEWHGCLGLYDRNYGKVTSDQPGRITLHCERPNSRTGLSGVDPELIIVPWGARRYLVATDALIDFCNEVNQRSEPRDRVHGSHLLRRGDEAKAAQGRPELPAPYKSYLLDSPLDATIRDVGRTQNDPKFPDEYRTTRVRLDVGKLHGVFVGMVLFDSEGEIFTQATVTEVEDNSSVAILRQDHERAKRPLPGWRLCTVPAWRR